MMLGDIKNGYAKRMGRGSKLGKRLALFGYSNPILLLDKNEIMWYNILDG